MDTGSGDGSPPDDGRMGRRRSQHPATTGEPDAAAVTSDGATDGGAAAPSGQPGGATGGGTAVAGDAGPVTGRQARPLLTVTVDVATASAAVAGHLHLPCRRPLPRLTAAAVRSAGL